MSTVVDLICDMKPRDRKEQIVDVFATSYKDLMQADPDAWRGKFRKMAASPFAFYRGSAAQFYADMAHEEDPYANEKTGRIWIHGDLHAANFGTYMNSQGILVFDVNDYDEAYVGPFTWDLKRLAASLTLLGYEKALSDDEIGLLIETAAENYADQVHAYASKDCDRGFALTLANTHGKLLEVLRAARLRSRWEMLAEETTIENYERRFTLGGSVDALDDPTRQKVEAAFHAYLKTIPHSKRQGKLNYRIKDVVGRRGVGIGSAGLQSFNILVEGPTEALENDIVIFIKQAIPAAPSRTFTDPAVSGYFKHDGHRTVLSQRALQAYADPWLGYTELDGVGQLVAEVSPFNTDLEWHDVDDFDDMVKILAYLGRAVAKIHCVSDNDSDQTLVSFSVEEALDEVIGGNKDTFVKDLREFGLRYGYIVRDDYKLFVDAFRQRHFTGL